MAVKPPASTTILDTGHAYAPNEACWAMLEGSGTTASDLTVNARHLTFYGSTGAPTWSTDAASDPIISFGTALNAPLTVTAFTLASGSDWAIAWRGALSANNSAGMVIGDRDVTTTFVWMNGGSYIRVRESSGDNSDFTETSLNSEHNWLLTYTTGSPNGTLRLYKDGTAVASSPKTPVAGSFTIDTVGNAYTSNTLAFVGTLTYVYVWSGSAATAIDATAAASINTDPYQFLIEGSTFVCTPTRMHLRQTRTVTMVGTNNAWLSENPVGLFTVSGGTGVTIGDATVTGDDAATVTVYSGTARGTITITDTSSGDTTTVDVVDAFAGGYLASAFAADANINGGDATGRTFVDTNTNRAIRQHGTITQVSVSVAAVSGSDNWKFKVLRKNGSNWDTVSSSETVTPAGTGTRVFVLSTPMACAPGDYVGLYLSGSGNIVNVKTATTDIKYTAADQTGTNWAAGSTVSSYGLDLEYRTDFVTALATGDSREAGHNGATYFYSWYESSGISGLAAAQPIHQLQALIDATRLDWTYQNFAQGSQTWAFVAGTAFPNMFTTYALAPEYVFTQCGVNDKAAARTNAAMLADLDTCYALLPAGTTWFIDECQPWTNGDDTEAADIRSWNTALAGWASGKTGVQVVSVFDAMGQLRVSTGELDDMATAYDYDGVHMTVSAGVDELAALRYAAYAPATNTTISGALGTATASGLQGAVNANRTIAGALGTAVASGLTGGVNANRTIAGALGTAVASGFQGTVSNTADVVINGTLGIAVASGLAGNVDANTTIAGALGIAYASGYQGGVVNGGAQTIGGGGWFPHIRRRTKKDIDEDRRRLGILPPEVVEAVAEVPKARRTITLQQLIGKTAAAQITSVDLSEAIAKAKLKKRRQDDELLMLM